MTMVAARPRLCDRNCFRHQRWHSTGSVKILDL